MPMVYVEQIDSGTAKVYQKDREFSTELEPVFVTNGVFNTLFNQ